MAIHGLELATQSTGTSAEVVDSSG